MAEFGGKRQVGPWSRASAGLGSALTLMPVPDSSALTPRQRRAAAALLRGPALAVAGLARRVGGGGHRLALVGGAGWGGFPGRPRRGLGLVAAAPPGGGG